MGSFKAQLEYFFGADFLQQFLCHGKISRAQLGGWGTLKENIQPERQERKSNSEIFVYVHFVCVCAFICFLKSYSEFSMAPFASTLTSSGFGAVPNMESCEPSNFRQNWNVWLQNGTNIGILGCSVEFELNVPLNVDFTRQNYDSVLNFSGTNASLIFA